MINIPSVFPLKDVSRYIKRVNYALGRRFVPSVRRMHRLESLVGPIGYWELLQEYQFTFLKNMGLRPNHTLLDIGCGPLQGGIKLIEYLDANHYFGVDLCHEPIVEAYRQVAHFKLVHKNPTLVVSNSFGKDELANRTFNFFWMSQLLYHLPLKSVDKILQHIRTQMTPTSACYGDIIDYDIKLDENAHWREFKFHHHQPCDLQEVAEKAGLNMNILGRIEEFGYPTGTRVLKKNYMLKFWPCVPQSSQTGLHPRSKAELSAS